MLEKPTRTGCNACFRRPSGILMACAMTCVRTSCHTWALRARCWPLMRPRFPSEGPTRQVLAHNIAAQPERLENCQVGVYLSYVTARGHALIDRELYLPLDWCEEAKRRQAAHIVSRRALPDQTRTGPADDRADPPGRG